jgi:hypothetical protein
MASTHLHALAVALAALPVAYIAGSAVTERSARADVPHYDIGFGIGPAKRFLGNKPDGGNDSSFGGAAQLNADIAIAPLFRVGGYFDWEVSPPPTGDVKYMYSFGGRVSFAPPLESQRLKLSFFAGLGYTVVYTHSFNETIPLQNSQGMLVGTPAQLAGVSGSFFEVPFGARLSYNVRKSWNFFTELRGTLGFDFGATLYNFDDTGGRPGKALGGMSTATGTDNDGTDAFGLALLFGVEFDR